MAGSGKAGLGGDTVRSKTAGPHARAGDPASVNWERNPSFDMGRAGDPGIGRVGQSGRPEEWTRL